MDYIRDIEGIDRQNIIAEGDFRQHVLSIDVVIEIPLGSHYKFEIDKSTGAFLRLDRVLKYNYPAAYGFVPRTMEEDLDPMDVFVMGLNEDFPPLTVVKCVPIGVVFMTDNGMPDNKIIAVPINGNVQQTRRMIEAQVKQIEWFLQNYKPAGCIEIDETIVLHIDLDEKTAAEKMKKITGVIDRAQGRYWGWSKEQ